MHKLYIGSKLVLTFDLVPAHVKYGRWVCNYKNALVSSVQISRIIMKITCGREEQNHIAVVGRKQVEN